MSPPGRHRAEALDGEIPPSAPWGHVADRLTGCFVALAITSLLYGGSPGTVFDLSSQECILPLVRRELAAWKYDNYVASRYERLWKVAPSGFYRTADGMVYLMVVEEGQWKRLCDVIGRPELANAPDFATGEERFARLDAIEQIISGWTRTVTCADLFRRCGEEGVPAAPVQSPLDLLSMPSLSERKYFHGGGELKGASRPPILSFDPASCAWRAAGIPPGLRRASSCATGPIGAAASLQAPISDSPLAAVGPLQGVRVLEFTHVWAGPLCGQFLADLGADVIRVESQSRIDVHRRAGPYAPGHKGAIDASGVWNAQNRGKRSCVVDIQDPEGRSVATSLAAGADVIVENFRPGTLAKLGLGYERLSERSPGLVYISLSGFGQSGSLREFPAYGPMLDALTGLAFLTRSASGAPQSVNGWVPDVSGGLYGAVAAVLGLYLKSLSGRGSWLDVSEVETTLALVTDSLVVAANTGVVDLMKANADPEGERLLVTAASGEDAWVALRYPTADLLRQGIEALDAGSAISSRAGTTDELSLEQHIQLLIAQRSPEDAAALLQLADLEAVPVASSAMLLNDLHLAARGGFLEVRHPVAGLDRTYAPVLRDRGTPVGGTRPAPTFGQHTDEVLLEAGLSPEEVRGLRERQLVGG